MPDNDACTSYVMLSIYISKRIFHMIKNILQIFSVVSYNSLTMSSYMPRNFPSRLNMFCLQENKKTMTRQVGSLYNLGKKRLIFLK